MGRRSTHQILFEKHYYEQEERPPEQQLSTQYIDVKAKSILNKVDSPDVPYPFSLNPYQGCEHGCIYCYARNTHPYWGYSAGLDFEQKILVKKDAAQLLAKRLRSKNWKAAPVMLSGNTDCYQPVERKLKRHSAAYTFYPLSPSFSVPTTVNFSKNFSKYYDCSSLKTTFVVLQHRFMSEQIKLDELQLKVMNVLWELGEASVSEIQSALEKQRSFASTTIATVLQRLHKRNIVSYRKLGRQYIYKAEISKDQTRRSMASRLVDQLFSGKSSVLVNHLLEEGSFEADELSELKQLIEQAQKRNEQKK